MSSPAESGVALPVVTGDHVHATLAKARGDNYEQFRTDEREWLEEHNGRYAVSIMQAYAEVIQNPVLGLEIADFMLAGAMMGNHSVRLACDGDLALYEHGYQNFARLASNPRPFGTTALWTTPSKLALAFGDGDIVPALMDVRQEHARHTMAFTIGHFTLPRLPELVLAIQATEVRR